MNDSERQLYDGFTFLLGIVVGGLAAAGLSLAARFMGSSADGIAVAHAEAAMTEMTESPLAPIGRIALLGDAELASAAAAMTAAPRPVDTVLSGPQVFNEACYQCHAEGAVIPGAPIVGDTAQWEARIAQGLEIVYEHAINGFQGEALVPMPPKGGRVDLSDDEIRSAVDYMIEQLP